jgi:hypothetical protein
MLWSDQIEELHGMGILNVEEFQAAKRKLLS